MSVVNQFEETINGAADKGVQKLQDDGRYNAVGLLQEVGNVLLIRTMATLKKIKDNPAEDLKLDEVMDVGVQLSAIEAADRWLKDNGHSTIQSPEPFK